MRTRPGKPILFCILFLFSLIVCGCNLHDDRPPRQKRPIAGDRVTPIILLGKSWKAKGPVLVSARLQVEGPEDSEPQLLQLEDVPYEIVPRVALTFYENEKEIEKLDSVELKRDC